MLALGMRLVLAPITFHSDMQIWYIVAKNIANGLSPYSAKYFTYPPLWAYVSYSVTFLVGGLLGGLSFANFLSPSMVASLHDGLSSNLIFVTTPTFNLLVKIPLIMADLSVGWLIYKYLLPTLGKKQATTATRLWLFNPLVIFVSSVNGQFDVLPAFCVLLATILFIKRDYLYAGILLGVGTMLKVYPLYVALLLGTLLLLNIIRPIWTKDLSIRLRVRTLVIFIVPFLVAIAVIAIPLFLNGSWTTMIYANSSRTRIYGGAGGATIFDLIYAPLIGWAVSAFIVGNILPLTTGLLYASGIAVILLGVFAWGKTGGAIESKDLMTSVLAVHCIVLFSLIEVNPQFVVWMLPFAIITMTQLSRTSIFEILFLSISMTLFGLVWTFPLASLAVSAPFLSIEIVNASASYSVFFRSVFAPLVTLTGLLSALIIYRFFFVSLRSIRDRSWARNQQ